MGILDRSSPATRRDSAQMLEAHVGRPKGRPKRERLVMYVSSEVKDAIARKALARGQSYSEYMRTLLFEAVQDQLQLPIDDHGAEHPDRP